MPSDFRNSLGWLNLQLQADDLKRRQTKADKMELMAREDEANQQALQQQMFGKALGAYENAENRKLQLAGMMQKAAEDRASRELIAGLNNNTKKDIAGDKLGLDYEKLAEVIRSHGVTEGQGQQKIDETGRHNTATEGLTERGQNLALGGKLAGVVDSYGDYRYDVDIPSLMGGNSPLGGLRLAPPRDPDVIRLPVKDVTKAAIEGQQNAASAERLGSIYDRGKAMKSTHWGLRGGRGPLNFLENLWAQGQTAVGVRGSESQKDAEERAAYASDVNRELAQTIHDFSGAQSSDPEARRLAQIEGLGTADLNPFTGGREIDPYAVDQDVFLKVVKQAQAYKEHKAQQQQQIAQDRGVRVKPKKAPGTSSAASSALSDDDIINALGDF